MALVTYDNAPPKPVTYGQNPIGDAIQNTTMNGGAWNNNPFLAWLQKMQSQSMGQPQAQTQLFTPPPSYVSGSAPVYYQGNNAQGGRGSNPAQAMQQSYNRLVARPTGLQATGLPGGTKPFSLMPAPPVANNYGDRLDGSPYRAPNPFGGLRNPALRRMEDNNPEGLSLSPQAIQPTQTIATTPPTTPWYGYGGGGGGGAGNNWYMNMLTWRT